MTIRRSYHIERSNSHKGSHKTEKENKKSDRVSLPSIGCSDVVNTTRSYAAFMRFRRVRAEAKGTPPISMASWVASIVTCDWPSLT